MKRVPKRKRREPIANIEPLPVDVRVKVAIDSLKVICDEHPRHTVSFDAGDLRDLLGDVEQCLVTVKGPVGM